LLRAAMADPEVDRSGDIARVAGDEDLAKKASSQ
jgi:hypothetical protein